MIEHNKNKQGQLEKQGVQEILGEQGHENEQQQKTDEILVKKADMEKCNEEENELLIRVVKEIRYDPETIPPTLR